MASNCEGDQEFRLCVIGRRGVGKKSIIKRYVEGTFPHLDIFCDTKLINANGKIITLRISCIWNLNPDPLYYAEDPFTRLLRRSQGCMIVFDVTDGFRDLNKYFEDVEIYCGPNTPVLLVGNKCDLLEHREVEYEHAKMYAQQEGVQYIETSAKTAMNIERAFVLLCELIHDERKRLSALSQFTNIKLGAIKGTNTQMTKSKRLLKQNLNRAKRQQETIPVRFIRLFFTGTGGAGKTSFVNLLLKRKFKEDHDSSPLAHADHAVSVKKAVIHGLSSAKADIRWIELDSALEISHLQSILLPKQSTTTTAQLTPAATSNNSNTSAERVASLSGPATNLLQYKPPKQKHSAVKRLLARLLVSSVNESSLSTFHSIIDVSQSDPIIQPGEVLNIITLLDTGGQPEYIHLLPTINIYPTVTFVIHNLSKSLTDQVLVEYSEHGKGMFIPYHLSYSNLDMIKLLMSAANDSVERPSSIIPQLVSTPGIDNKSYVCLVGTHVDKVSKETETEVESELNTLVTKMDCEAAVWQKSGSKSVLFPVDNTTAGRLFTEDPLGNVIRSRIESLAEDKDIYELPITWMLLELEIRHHCSEKNKSYISFCDCVNLARETGLMSKEEEIKSVLLYHHLLGVLIYFEEVPGLCEYVIVDHQWWFDKLSGIITSTFQHSSLDYHAMCKLKYQGLLSKELLQHIKWRDEIKEEFFLSLLVHMRIIAPVLTEVEEYFIPFILSTYNLQQKNMILAQYGHLQGEPLLVHFKSGLLPRGMFCSLIVQLLQHPPKGWHPIFSVDGTQHTFSNLITFRLLEGYSLSLLDGVSHMEVQIRHPEKEFRAHVSAHNVVFNYLVYALTDVCTHLNFDYDRLQYGFICTCGKGIDNHIAVLPAITSSMAYAECSNNNLYLLKLNSSHLLWFSPEQILPLSRDQGELCDGLEEDLHAAQQAIKDIKLSNLRKEVLLEIFQVSYKQLTKLPMDAMYPTLMSKGLLKGDLAEKIQACHTNTLKACHLLDSINKGIKIGVSKEFDDLLVAMLEHAAESNDQVLKQVLIAVMKTIYLLVSENHISDTSTSGGTSYIKLSGLKNETLKDIFYKYYSQLVYTLPMNSLFQYLKSNKLLKGNLGETILQCSTEAEKVHCLLAIEKGIDVGYAMEYESLLYAIKEYADANKDVVVMRCWTDIRNAVQLSLSEMSQSDSCHDQH